jgi:hypothetical protein
VTRTNMQRIPPPAACAAPEAVQTWLGHRLGRSAQNLILRITGSPPGERSNRLLL